MIELLTISGLILWALIERTGRCNAQAALNRMLSDEEHQEYDEMIDRVWHRAQLLEPVQYVTPFDAMIAQPIEVTPTMEYVASLGLPDAMDKLTESKRICDEYMAKWRGGKETQ